MKTKLSWHFYVVCAIISVVVMIIATRFRIEKEYPYEMADLQAMRNAELTAVLKWKDKLPEETTEYWYNPNSFELIPASEPKPESHGLGRKGKGGAVREFEADTGLSYEYDEGTDYTGKVIHVTVSNKGGDLDIKVDWVNAE